MLFLVLLGTRKGPTDSLRASDNTRSHAAQPLPPAFVILERILIRVYVEGSVAVSYFEVYKYSIRCRVLFGWLIVRSSESIASKTEPWYKYVATTLPFRVGAAPKRHWARYSCAKQAQQEIG